MRGGAGTALVGSHTEVADRIAEYAEIGIDEFIFSGYPHLEELFWFGEGVVPILRERGLFGGGDAVRHPGLDSVRRRAAMTDLAGATRIASTEAALTTATQLSRSFAEGAGARDAHRRPAARARFGHSRNPACWP